MSNSYVNTKFGNDNESLRFLDELQIRVARYKAAGLADRHFEQHLYGPSREIFFERIWELNLAEHLQECGLELRSANKGPDFLAEIEGRKVWFEATAPCPKGIPDDYLEPIKQGDSFKCGDALFLEVLLRVTSALSDKSKKILKYIKDGCVDKDDICVIAVDTSMLGVIPDIGVSQLPIITEVTCAVGPMVMQLDTKTNKIVSQALSYRKCVIKETEKGPVQIPTDFFFSGKHLHISAAIGSFGANRRKRLALVHNLTAINPMPLKRLKVDQEFVQSRTANGFTLVDVLAQVHE